MSILLAEDVWKKFRIPHERSATVLDHIGAALSVLEGRRHTYEEFWALKQINFNLEHGESLGLIGPNGSGKTTLLKLIARVMKPDRGAVKTDGTMASVLELGIGFHGDLTVRENALVYGVIMGLPRPEMRKRTDAILDFAGLTRFQDAKLRTLSSGMQVRLAFSIAVQTEADIFLVDEALAVGDAEFQQKCLDRFREFKKEKKSIVLVSHNMELIRGFCEKTVYLREGEVRAFGASQEATNRYVQDMKRATAPQTS
jgi:lipopolysaccharide transport system ATP-binding protein